MNKTSLSIRMLMLLKTNGRMKAKEIADILETNPRNIVIYKNELEMAGFVIDHKTGPYGGYSLHPDALLPGLALKEEEWIALEQANKYIKAHTDFEYRLPFLLAYSKICMAHRSQSKVDWNYVYHHGKPLSQNQKKWIKEIEKAMRAHHRIEILYQGRKDADPHWIVVDPYGFINQDGKYYLSAYSNKSQGYRTYRLSDERLKEVKWHDSSYTMRTDYHSPTQVGESLKERRIEVWVAKAIVRFFKEQHWGKELTRSRKEEAGEVYSFVSEDIDLTFDQIFHFRAQIKILAPQDLVLEYSSRLETILHLYDR